MSNAAATDFALAHDLRLAVMRLARRLRAERPESAMTLSQISALASVERHGPVTPGELAAHERVSPPSMTKVIAALESAGMVSRTSHPADRRQALVAISAAGTGFLREDRRRREAWLARRVAELTADERAALHAAVAVIDRLAST